LHRRAAAWLLDEGSKSEAISHLLRAQDYSTAVELIAESWYPVAASGGQATVRSWLDSLPEDVSAADARLCVARALVAISYGQLDEVQPALDSITKAPPPPGRFFDGFTSGRQAAGVFAAAYRWLLGDLGGCRDAALAALSSGEAPSPWDSLARMRLGASSYWLGDVAEGISNLELGRAGASATPLHPAWISSLGMLALVRLEEGDQAIASDLVTEARDVIRGAGLAEYWVSAPTHIASGALMLRSGRIDDAIAELNRGLELAARGSGPIETAYGQVLLSRALSTSGDRQQSERMLAEARWTVESSLDPGPAIARFLGEAEQELQVKAPPAFDAELLDELSDRELSVLRLMSGDLSQREMGEHLYISFNTVKTHSKHIYRKLGVSQRSEAVARARQLNLI
jgi:LuxR family maltose regulon positive regulatory protein